MSIIFHVDVNSAFLSWEAVFRLRVLGEELDLRTIPSAVGGDRESRKGIILARSIPAKEFNVKTAEPIADALRKCPNLVIVPGRYDFYKECSNAFMDVLREYSDLVEPFSVDEAFVDLSENADCRKDPVAFANRIRTRIKEELGFTVNIGISENKLLSKMASDFKKPDLCHTLWQREVPTKMWPLPVQDLLFVGASTAGHLHTLGIKTIGELAALDPALLKSHMGKNADYLHRAANGIDDSSLNIAPSDNKGYSRSTTLASNIVSTDEAKRVLLSLCDSIGIRLRADNALVKVIAVSIRDNRFNTHSRQMTMTNATNITNELYSYCCKIFEKTWDTITPIRQLGVHTSGVTNEASRQYSLFDTQDFTKQQQAEKAMDLLRGKFGKSCITRGSLLNPPQNS